MRTIGTFCLLAFLGGCAVQSSVLINERGQQVGCGAWGVGIIGATAAVGTYAECMQRQRALGYVELAEYEKTEPPKVEPRANAVPSKTAAAALETGYSWTYQLSGSDGTVRTTTKHEVTGTDIVAGVKVYVLNTGPQVRQMLSEELNLVQVEAKGERILTYTPPMRHYDWPLEARKRWEGQAQAQTRTGTLNTVIIGEVRGYGTVRVPAGEFEAFYIVLLSQRGSRIREVWYSPQVRRHVKAVEYLAQGRVVYELVSYSLTASKP